ncbi:MlaE family ABC transporter permease [Campylobacter corcagiensis]|uniref:MlaE family ABC transporter permease n=1 Tax=Campylobacter corcagiensis TaxID=1448857 RepID=UPI0004716EE5|nr:ABC transporter permease [Campylobacter corcagiensis]QKF64652.1 lipid asymmetry ABC transporter MlaABCDEF, permease component MlaE [Campylobacter corcagiensis]
MAINFEISNNCIKLIGDWDYKSSPKKLFELKKAIKKLPSITLDITQLEKLDYAVAIIIYNESLDKNLEIKGENKSIKAMFELLADSDVDIGKKPTKRSSGIFYDIGKNIFEATQSAISFFNFFGEFVYKFLYTILHPSKIRLKELSNHCKDSGINAVFIVCLTAFLIGIVLVYIGSDMLANFGANIMIVEIMGMITLREIGPLIATIVLAGRSASSFTAQIGVMKITEEIDAMKTMSFDPFIFLVIPRVMAMIIITPLVIFLADMCSILGQMIVSNYYMGVDFASYLDRFKSLVEIRHFQVGMIKAPFFGATIALVGCLRGLQVKGSTESIGEMTTISVVNAIFWVIVLDAIFAIFFIQVGL